MRKTTLNPADTSQNLCLRAIRGRAPLRCLFELTYQCNFSCKMCYVHMSDERAAPLGRLLTAEEWLTLAREARDEGVLYITLTGGECTTHSGFEKIYTTLMDMGFFVTLMSNAGFYGERIKALFREIPPRDVGITLYGGTDQSYGAVTGDSRGFTRVRENIAFLRALGARVSLNFTMIRDNVLDYPLVDAYARSEGLSYTSILDITPRARDGGYSEATRCRLSPAEQVCVSMHPPGEVALALARAEALKALLSDFRAPEKRGATAEKRGATAETEACVGASVSCAILWNGEMRPCLSYSGAKYAPLETGFRAAWTRMQADRDRAFALSPTCAACEMRKDCVRRCPGRFLEGTGDARRPDPDVCQYAYLFGRYRQTREKERAGEEIRL